MNHEKLSIPFPRPHQHTPILPGQTVPYQSGNPGAFRGIFNKHNSLEFELFYHDPKGDRTARGHHKMNRANYHSAKRPFSGPPLPLINPGEEADDESAVGIRGTTVRGHNRKSLVNYRSPPSVPPLINPGDESDDESWTRVTNVRGHNRKSQVNHHLAKATPSAPAFYPPPSFD